MACIPLTRLHERLALHCQDIYTDYYLSMHEHIDKKSTGVQCLFLVEHNQLVICYRGSDTTTDWRWNFYLPLTEYPKDSGCHVHSGFLVQWVSVEDEFKEKLRNLLEKNLSTNDFNEVIFSGHSAGGQCCLAAYSCRSILEEYKLPVRVITFGSPRIGDINFKNNLESFTDCTRIVLDRDVITRIPLIGYEHVGKPIQIRDECILERETSTLEHFHWILLGLKNNDAGIKDHFVWNYYGSIRKWLSNISPETEVSEDMKTTISDLSQVQVETDEDLVEEVDEHILKNDLVDLTKGIPDSNQVDLTEEMKTTIPDLSQGPI